MKPCPKCGCSAHRLAYSLDEAGTRVAVACYNRACDYTGPFTPVTFPPNREDCSRAADLWDVEIFRQSLPARLRNRLPALQAAQPRREPDPPVLNGRTAGKLH